MTTEEAIALIAETNEPLATVLRDILTKMDKLDRNQKTVIEPLISSIISKGATIDLTEIVKILKQQGGN